VRSEKFEWLVGWRAGGEGREVGSEIGVLGEGLNCLAGKALVADGVAGRMRLRPMGISWPVARWRNLFTF
jgi:hypothetical protein